jgi:hypothetical protein
MWTNSVAQILKPGLEQSLHYKRVVDSSGEPEIYSDGYVD